MMTNLFFIIGGLVLFIYAAKQKNNTNKQISFPIPLGILSILFGLFRWNDFVVGEFIVGISALLIIITNFIKKK
ncbi:Uncharacterised protein [Mycobacteroides abscessus subsp. abscessus]|nr:Uncharacterised protein [Mycobacteroides abscessus subsp. abscessus]